MPSIGFVLRNKQTFNAYLQLNEGCFHCHKYFRQNSLYKFLRLKRTLPSFRNFTGCSMHWNIQKLNSQN